MATNHDQKAAEDKLLADYRAVFEYLKNPPKTSQELYHWIQAFTGEQVPYARVCENHLSPFDVIWRGYRIDLPDWHDKTKRNLIAMGPRNGQKTLSVAKLLVTEMLMKPKCSSLGMGAVLTQADRCYNYATRYIKHPIIQESQIVTKLLKTKMEMANGSSYEQCVATLTGVNSAHCLAGDTYIETLDGRRQIKDLVGTVGKWIFAWDEKNNKFVIDRIKNVWRVGKNKTYSVILDNTTTVRATSEHKFYIRGKGWVAVKDLTPGDSVIPLRRYARLQKETGHVYMTLSPTLLGGSVWEHRFVVEHMIGRRLNRNEHVHHLKEKWNNNPENLVPMNNKDHATLHGLNRSEEGAAKCLEATKRWHEFIKTADPKRHADHMAKLAEGGRRWREANKEKLVQRMASYWQDPAYRKAREQTRRIETDDNEIVRLYESEGLSPQQISTIVCLSPALVRRRLIKSGAKMRSRSEAKKIRFLREISNHKIVSVQEYFEEDVYDIEMENFFSFVANGIVVHNSPKLRVDEVDLCKPEVLEEAKMMPVSMHGLTAHTLYTSTRKFFDGPMQQLMEEKRLRDFEVVTWCWKEVSEPCPEWRRGKEKKAYEIEDIENPGETLIIEAYAKCGSCPLLATCKGDLARSRGNVPIEDSINEYLQLDKETWLAQKCCRTPKRGRLMFYDFSRKYNVKVFDYDPRFPIDLAFDFTNGGDSPTVCQWWQEDDAGNNYLLMSKRWLYKPTSQIAQDIKDWSIHWGLKHHEQFRLQIGDSAQQQMIRDLQDEDPEFFRITACSKIRRDEGWPICRRLVKDNTGVRRLFVHQDQAKDFIREIENAQRGRTNPNDLAPNAEDHDLDAWRYREVKLRLQQGHEPRIRFLTPDGVIETPDAIKEDKPESTGVSNLDERIRRWEASDMDD